MTCGQGGCIKLIIVTILAESEGYKGSTRRKDSNYDFSEFR